MNCIYYLLFGLLYVIMSITFFWKLSELRYAEKEELPDCPVATTVQLIGNKWKLLILRNLLARPWRFNELRRSLDGISQKVPPRVEYSLSELGETLRLILDAMQAWGQGYKQNIE